MPQINYQDRRTILLSVAGALLLISVLLLMGVAYFWNSAQKSTLTETTESFESFLSEIELDRAGELQVIEKIQVRTEGKVMKRGFCRRLGALLPPAENSAPISFEILWKQNLNGMEFPAADTPERTTNNVCFGLPRDSEELLPHGSHEFLYHYIAKNSVRFNAEGRATFTWSLADATKLPILHYAATLKIPRPIGGEGKIEARILSRKSNRESREEDRVLAIQTSSDEEIVEYHLTTQRKVEPGESVVLDIDMPSESFVQPTMSIPLPAEESLVGG